jgi:predicted dehydrogenase
MAVVDADGGETEGHGRTFVNWPSRADPMAFTHDWHRAVIEDFATALTENRPPAITGTDALAVHDLIDALIRSAREGQFTKVRP